MKNKKQIIYCVVTVLMIAALSVLLTLSASAAGENVVQITGKGQFTSIENAYSAATSGDTIVLLDDISYPANTSLVFEGKEISLDLNGHKLSQTSDNGTSFIKLGSGIALTVKDSAGGGEIIYSGANINCAISGNYSAINVESGKIVVSGSGDSVCGIQALYSHSKAGNASVHVGNAEIVLSNVSATTAYGIDTRYFTSSGAIVSVENVKQDGKTYGIYCYETGNISSAAISVASVGDGCGFYGYAESISDVTVNVNSDKACATGININKYSYYSPPTIQGPFEIHASGVDAKGIEGKVKPTGGIIDVKATSGYAYGICSSWIIVSDTKIYVEGHGTRAYGIHDADSGINGGLTVKSGTEIEVSGSSSKSFGIYASVEKHFNGVKITVTADNPTGIAAGIWSATGYPLNAGDIDINVSGSNNIIYGIYNINSGMSSYLTNITISADNTTGASYGIYNQKSNSGSGADFWASRCLALSGDCSIVLSSADGKESRGVVIEKQTFDFSGLTSLNDGVTLHFYDRGQRIKGDFTKYFNNADTVIECGLFSSAPAYATITCDGTTGYERTIVANVDAESKSDYPYTLGIAAVEGSNGLKYTDIRAALSDVPNNSTLKLLKNISETVTVSSGIEVTIDLNGYVLSPAADNEPVLTVDSGSIRIIDTNPLAEHYFTKVLLSEIDSSAVHGYVYRLSDTPTAIRINGGLIYGAVNKTANDGIGAGIVVTNSSSVIMSSGNIVGCYARQGGAAAAVDSGSIFSFVGSANIEGCASLNNIVCNSGALNISGGSIKNNSMRNSGSGEFAGGAVVNYDGTAVISGGSISDNESDACAGISVVGGTVRLLGGTISGNSSTSAAAAIEIFDTADKFVIGNTVVIKDNFGNCTDSASGLTGGNQSNLYLHEDARISVEDIYAPAWTEAIGVTLGTADGTGPFAENVGSDIYKSYFKSDSSAIYVNAEKISENNYTFLLDTIYTVTITWCADDFTYNGTAQTLTATYLDLGGNIVPLVLTIDGNKDFINAGEYTVSASFASGTVGYALPADVSKQYTIKKANAIIDSTGIVTAYVFSGNEIVVSGAVLNHSETNLVYSGNKFTNAGEYIVTVSAAETANYLAAETKLRVIVSKKNTVLDLSGITTYYIYSGNEIVVSGATLNHNETALSYSGNKFTNAGEYTVTVSALETTNYTAAQASIKVSVGKKQAVIDLSDITTVYVYSGNEIVVSGATLNHNETVLSYSGNKFTNAGEYTVTVSAAETTNYTAAQTSIKISVGKKQAVIDVSGITTNYVFNGNEIVVSGATLNHNETALSYSGNKFTNAGEYTVTVSAAETANYTAAESKLKVKVSKKQAVIDISNIITGYIFNGNEIVISGATLNHNETNLVYTGNKFTNAGEYTVTVSAAETANYLAAEAKLKVKVSKKQAVIDISNIITGYIFNGNEIVISGASLNHNETNLVYSGNKFTNAGEYTVTVSAAETANYTAAQASIKISVGKKQAVIDISNIITGYIFNGNEIVVSGAVLNHNETELSYSGNKFTNAGEYTVTVSAAETANYTAAQASIKISVGKKQAVIDLSGITTNYVFNGNEIVISGATLNHNETNLVYSGNKFTNAGEYTVTVTAAETTNYTAAQASIKISVGKKQAVIDLSGITTNYVFNGNEIVVSGAVLNHNETELVYSGNKFTNAGEYTVTLSAAETANYTAAQTSIKISVGKKQAVIDLSGITTNYFFNGNEIVISGAVLNHSETELVYSGNKFTNAGEYTVTVSAAETANYTAAESKLKVKVSKKQAVIDISNIITGYIFNGNEIVISGATLNHNETNLVYTGNKFTNAGEYTVTVSAAETANYLAAEAKLKVKVSKKQAVIDISNIITGYIFNGNEIVVSGAVLNHNETELVYSGNKFTNAGEYTVTVSAAETANYTAAEIKLKAIVTKEKEVIIKKQAVIDLSGINTNYVFSGNEIVISGATLNHNETELVYSGNKFTNAGEYIVTVTAAETANYTAAEAKLKITVSKKLAVIDLADITTTYIFNGNEIIVSGATLNHNETTLSYSGNKFTNAGEYTVTVTATETANYTAAEAKIKITVSKKQALINISDITTGYVFSGNEIVISGATLNHNETALSYSGNKFTNAGEYTVTVSAAETANYTAAETKLKITVNKAIVAEPYVKGEYKFDGTEQKVTLVGVESYMTTSDSLTETQPGDYTITFVLDENHEWAAGADGVVKWSIQAVAAEQPQQDKMFHWIISAVIIIFVVFISLLFFAFRKRKHDLSTVIACVFFAVIQTTLYILSEGCNTCLIMLIVSAVLLTAAMLMFLPKEGNKQNRA